MNKSSQWKLFVHKAGLSAARITELLIVAALKLLEVFLDPFTWLTIIKLYVLFFIAHELRYLFLYAQFYAGSAGEVLIMAVQTVVNGVIKAVDSAGSGVVSVLSFGTHRHAVNIKPVDFIDDVGFIREMKDILSQCNHYDTYSDEVFVFFKMMGNSHICPVIRYTWPVSFIYTPLSVILSPVSYDARPTPGCVRPVDLLQCEFANIYRFFELGIYVYIAYEILKACWPFIKYVVFECILYSLETVSEEIYHAIHDRVERIHVSLGLPKMHTM